MVFHRDKDVKPLKYPFVKSIFYMHNYIKKNVGYDYWYMNIYNRKTGVYLKRQYSDEFIVDKPPY